MVRPLAAPILKREDLAGYAALVHRTTLTVLLAVSAFCLTAVLLVPANRQRWIGVALSYAACTLAALAINHSGRPWHASLLLTFFNWSLMTALAWTGGGLQAPSSIGYMIVVFIAGSLLGAAAGIYVGVFCCLTGAGLVVAERLALLPQGAVVLTSFNRWIADVAMIAMATGIQYRSSRSGRDALERAAAALEIQRRLSETKFQTLFENAGDAILLMQDGRLVDCNPRALEIFGCQSRDQILGKSPSDFSPPLQANGQDSSECVLEKIAAASAGQPQRFEWLHKRSDGTPFSAEVTLNAVELAGAKSLQAIVRDITERKRADAVLRESEAKFRALFNLVPGSMAIHDLDGRLLDSNATFCRACGRSREEIAGRLFSDFYELHHSGNREGDLAPALAVLHEALRMPVELTVVDRTSGSSRIVILSAVMITLDGKQRFLTCGLNITELRRVEHQFRQAQKMEAIGRLAGGVAHDFNNLLTVIGGYTRLALTELSEKNRLYGSLLEVSKASERAASLTRQLLVFSRDQALAPAVVDLNALILDTAKMLRLLIGEDVDLSISLSEGLPSVRVDSGQIVQVLMNLAVNASDAMPEGGRLVIETDVVEIGDQRARATNLQPGAHVCLRVRDTGTGMDQETQSHIFEPFFTTKPAGQGTGLGLSLVYGIVAQGGGSIAVTSQPGAGSVFEILLPAVEPAELTQEQQPSEALIAGTETVLLAEDDQAIRKLAMQVLGRAGYAVLEAANGTEALTIARSHEGPIDLLVTDVKMPGGGGLEVARALRNARPEMAVLFMSGYSNEKTLEEIRADGRAEMIWKPFSPAALLKHARRALDARPPGASRKSAM
jgi:PAS domain S-box-containing protein